MLIPEGGEPLDLEQLVTGNPVHDDQIPNREVGEGSVVESADRIGQSGASGLLLG